MRPRTVSLNLEFLDISEEAEKHVREFFNICQNKFTKGEKKHGYLRGDTDYRAVYDHLLSEVGELIYAMDGDFWEPAMDVILDTIRDRSRRDVDLDTGNHREDQDPARELADVTNLPVLVYVCGKIQGAGEL